MQCSVCQESRQQQTYVFRSCVKCRSILCIQKSCLQRHQSKCVDYHEYAHVEIDHSLGLSTMSLESPWCDLLHSSNNKYHTFKNIKFVPAVYKEEEDMKCINVGSYQVYSWWCRCAHPHTDVLDVGVLRDCLYQKFPIRTFKNTTLLAHLNTFVLTGALNKPEGRATLRAYLYELALHIKPQQVWTHNGTRHSFELASSTRRSRINQDTAQLIRMLMTDFVCYEWFHEHGPPDNEVDTALYEEIQTTISSQRRHLIHVALFPVCLPVLVQMIVDYDLVCTVPIHSVTPFVPL